MDIKEKAPGQATTQGQGKNSTTTKEYLPSHVPHVNGWFRYWMPEKESKWQPIPDGPDVQERAKELGAMFLTCHAIDGDPDQETPPNRRGDMHLDFDHDTNPACAFDEMRQVVPYLEQVFDVAPEQLEIFLSGGKGGHIVIPAEIIGMEPSPHLHLEQKRFACKLAADLDLKTIDLGIYSGGKGRQFRLPNVRRKNGRYKVSIMANELMGLANADLQELTMSARELDETAEPCLSEILHGLFTDYREQVAAEQSAVQDCKPLSAEDAKKLQEGIPPCIKAILALTHRPPNGNFNQLVLNLVAYFNTAEYDLGAALETARPFLESYQDSTAYTTPAARTKHFKEMLLYVRNNSKFGFDCSYILGLKLPGSAFDCKQCKLGKSEPEEEKKQTYGFRLVHVNEMPCDPPNFLVAPYLETGTFACIFGDPGSGKTFMGMDIAGSVATEILWHGHKVKSGSVIYIAGEGLGGIGRRKLAWEIRNQTSLAEAPLYFSTGPTSLCDIEGVNQLIKAIDTIAQDNPPHLVVIDTLARNFGSGDENSTKDMSMAIQGLDAIRLKYGCTVLLIHHTGHGEKNRARGAMALKGALDAEYKMEKDDQGTVRFSALKMKEAELPPPLAFEIRSVGLGMYDEDGQEITSAILDQVEYEPPKNQKTGKWQQVAQEKLAELYQIQRETLQDGGYDPAGARVRISTWRDACFDAGMPKQRFYDIKKRFQNDKSFVYLSGPK